MRLIQKKVQNSTWWKGFAKKASAVAVASAVTFGSIFGLTTCESRNNVKEDEKDSSISEEETETEQLKELVASLSKIVSELNTNDELKNELAEINQKLADIESGKIKQDSVVKDLIDLVVKLQNEVNSIKDRLDAEENKTNEDKIGNISDELAKMKSKLAITNAFEYNYMQVGYDGVKIFSAPNGDVVGDRGMHDDYCYYDNDQQIAYMSNDGEECFGIVNEEQIEHLDFKSMCIKSLSDDSFVLNEELSSENQYVFKSEEGLLITIKLEAGELVSFENNYVEITKTTKENFESVLLQCKKQLKMIGLFEKYKKELASSLQYKYAEVLGTAEGSYGTLNASGVFSGVNGATTTNNSSGNNAYNIQTKDEQYSCLIDESGTKIEEVSYNDNAVDVAQSFRDMCSPKSNELTYTISQDEGTGTYTFASYYGDELDTKIEIKFNDDLSIDCKCTFANEVIVYHISQISSEKYTEVFNRINAICQEAKEQDATITQ